MLILWKKKWPHVSVLCSPLFPTCNGALGLVGEIGSQWLAGKEPYTWKISLLIFDFGAWPNAVLSLFNQGSVRIRIIWDSAWLSQCSCQIRIIDNWLENLLPSHLEQGPLISLFYFPSFCIDNWIVETEKYKSAAKFKAGVTNTCWIHIILWFSFLLNMAMLNVLGIIQETTYNRIDYPFLKQFM